MRKAHPARVPEYLQHIIEAIDRATGYVAGMDATAFEQDTRTQDAVIRALEIVGEAANKARVADPTLQDTAPEIPWDVMYGMRNRSGCRMADDPAGLACVASADRSAAGADFMTAHLFPPVILPAESGHDHCSL